MRQRLLVLLDRSLSMWQIRDGVLWGLNDLIEQNQGRDDVEFYLITFNEVCDSVLTRASMSEIGPFPADDYEPDGGTALYDAIKRGILTLRLDEQFFGPAPTTVAIITDGMDSHSKTPLNEVTDLVSAARKDGWEFVLMAANQDPGETAWKMGLNTALSIPFDMADASISCAIGSISKLIEREER